MGILIFFFKIPPILKLEVGFFSDKKSFSQIFQNTANFLIIILLCAKFQQNQRNFFDQEVGRQVGRQGGSSLPLASLACCQVRGVEFRCTRLRCTRLWHRTCKTSRSKKSASLPRFAASRGTSLRSWFQKKCLLPMRILIFFSQNTPTFEN